jgi:aminoglycoside 3-N-acetyltransferase I
MNETTRYSYERLAASDAVRLRQILDMFGVAFDNPEAYHHRQPDEAYLARLLGQAHFIAMAALCDGEVVGGLTAYVLDKCEQDRREIYIYDLAVLEAHRRKGVATGIIGELKRVARERGAFVIFVQADIDDAPAMGLYQSLGKRMTAHHFDIDVD